MEITINMDKGRNEFFMQEAFIQAKNALKLDEIPVGAVVVLNEEIIGKGFNPVSYTHLTLPTTPYV